MNYKPKKVLKNHPAAMCTQQVVGKKYETLYLLESKPESNWDIYINEFGDNTYYIAKPNSGCDSGWYGSLEYYFYIRKQDNQVKNNYNEWMQTIKKRLKELGFINSNTIELIPA